MERGAPRTRTEIVYCVVPRELADRLHEPLRGFFRDDPGVEVVVERRSGERRRGERRRLASSPPPSMGELRRARPQGRRVAERRSAVVESPAPQLPLRFRRHAGRLRFVNRVVPAEQEAFDIEADRLVARFQAGDEAASSELYLLFFDMVYAYARTALRDHHEAEDVTQQVFLDAISALPRYEIRPGEPLRAWLLVIARHAVLRARHRRRRMTLVEPGMIEERLHAGAEAVEAQLEWLSDQEVRFFVERLPDAQREVIVLRFMLGLAPAEVARALERTADSVYSLQWRALRTLEANLLAVPKVRKVRASRTPTLVRVRRAPVLRARRWALDGPAAGRSPGTGAIASGFGRR